MSARIVKRVTSEEKKKIQFFCKEHGITESEFFGLLIHRALSSVSDEVPITLPDDVKNKKITIRLDERTFMQVESHAQEEGFSNRTSWLRNLLVAKINSEPMLSVTEVAALRESNRELSAIGRNLNQIARAINIEFRESDKLRHEYLVMLNQVIEEHKEQVANVINAAMQRVR